MRSTKLIFSLALFTSASLLLAGCTYFNKDAQDKAACDKISEILVATGESANNNPDMWGKTTLGNAPEEVMSLADRIENEAMPLASMSFAETLKLWVKSVRKLDSKSIFDVAGGTLVATDRLSEVVNRCTIIGATY